jgi:hypothetical protein
LLIVRDYVSQHHELDRDQKKKLKLKALSGNELVTARLGCALVEDSVRSAADKLAGTLRRLDE